MKKIYYSLACCLIGGMLASCGGGAKKSNATEEAAAPTTTAVSYSKSLKAPETDSLNLPIDADGYITIFDGKSLDGWRGYNHQDTSRTTQIIDSIVTHRVWGYPIFFLFLYLMFEGTFVLGDYPMQGIEWLVGELGDLICNRTAEGPSGGWYYRRCGRCHCFPAEYSVALFLYFLDGRLGLYGTCRFHYG